MIDYCIFSLFKSNTVLKYDSLFHSCPRRKATCTPRTPSWPRSCAVHAQTTRGILSLTRSETSCSSTSVTTLSLVSDTTTPRLFVQKFSSVTNWGGLTTCFQWDYCPCLSPLTVTRGHVKLIGCWCLQTCWRWTRRRWSHPRTTAVSSTPRGIWPSKPPWSTTTSHSKSSRP